MVDVGDLILRVVVGIVLAAHGVPKLWWKREFFNKKWKEEYHLPLGSVVLTGLLQVVGGVALIVGIFSQIFALLLALNMLVATYISIWNHGEGFLSTPEGKGWDVNFLILGALVVITLTGEGKFSLAEWLQ